MWLYEKRTFLEDEAACEEALRQGVPGVLKASKSWGRGEREREGRKKEREKQG